MRHKLVPTLGSFNDRSSSLQVGTGVIVMLYPHANYGGGSVLYEKSFAHLDGGNDQVSSLIIRPKAAGEDWRAALRSGGGFGVKLREKDVGKQESGFYPLPERLDELEARYPVLGKMNDKANIVWLRGDIEVILFEHANFAGKPLKLPGAGYTPASDQVFNLLKYQFGRRASSLVVRARGPQQQILPGQIKLPPPPPPREGSEGTKHRAPSAPVSIAPKTIKSIQPASEFEMETNRPGQDYRSFDLAAPDPKQCRNACLEDKNCRAWSYVKPGVQGSKARCWLKNAVPPAKPSNCCISGVK